MEGRKSGWEEAAEGGEILSFWELSIKMKS